MGIPFHRFFNTHTIYVTIGAKIYKLNKKDLSREEVLELPVFTQENPIMLIDKTQFDMAKEYMFNINNPFRISLDDAETYNQIGFISNEELSEYKNKLEQNDKCTLDIIKRS